MVIWQVGRVIGWQADRLAGWKVGRLTGWQVGRLAVIVCCFGLQCYGDGNPPPIPISLPFFYSLSYLFPFLPLGVSPPNRFSSPLHCSFFIPVFPYLLYLPSLWNFPSLLPFFSSLHSCFYSPYPRLFFLYLYVSICSFFFCLFLCVCLSPFRRS